MGAADELTSRPAPALRDAVGRPPARAPALAGLRRDRPLSGGAGHDGPDGEAVLGSLATALLDRYRRCRGDDWHWFLDTLAYDDARLARR